jgi:hypothetical protein
VLDLGAVQLLIQLFHYNQYQHQLVGQEETKIGRSIDVKHNIHEENLKNLACMK